MNDAAYVKWYRKFLKDLKKIPATEEIPEDVKQALLACHQHALLITVKERIIKKDIEAKRHDQMRDSLRSQLH